jgi:hypothetical protein
VNSEGEFLSPKSATQKTQTVSILPELITSITSSGLMLGMDNFFLFNSLKFKVCIVDIEFSST